MAWSDDVGSWGECECSSFLVYYTRSIDNFVVFIWEPRLLSLALPGLCGTVR